MLVAALLSLALHTAALAVLPAWLQEPEKPAPPLTVELQPPPPPKPLPPPEPPKPEPEKPKPQPKKQPPPPKPLPTPQPRQETPPPMQQADTPPPPPPPAVIAATPKASEPPPTFTAPTPEPPPRQVTPPPDLDAARNNYGSLLSREFAKHKQYPRVAQMRGWQGTVRIELQIDASGKVTTTTIVEPSEFEILNKQALEMVRKASPLPLPPEALRGREFTIVVPISFKLE